MVQTHSTSQASSKFNSPAVFNDLNRLDLPKSLIQAWASRMGRKPDDPLLRLQEKAFSHIKELRSDHTLVLGPTSGGKTFVGEVLAAKVAFSGEGNVIYAVPYRAIATQKWNEWRKVYHDAGYTTPVVYVSSSDHVRHDALLSQGDFRIAIIVYEKLAALIAQGTKILSKCRTLIVDEFQMLGQRDRGPRLEFILTKILNTNKEHDYPVNIVGLSATISRSSHELIDSWLSGPQGVVFEIEDAVRPVELKESVVCVSGLCLSKNTDGQIVRESLTLPDTPPNLKFPNSLTASIVAKCVKEGKGHNILVFRGSRRQTSVTAQTLTGLLPAVTDGIAPAKEALKQLERSPFVEQMESHLYRKGIAYHNASLSFEERDFVEDSFSDPQMPISIVCSTETLAVGVNLPADTVIITDLRRPGGSDRGTVPLSLSDYKNMVGRAGRYGYLDTYTGQQISGQSFIFALDETEAQALFEKYIQPDDPGQELKSAVRSPDLQHQILAVLSSKKDISVHGLELPEVREFLSESLYAQSTKNLERNIGSAWRYLQEKELIEPSVVEGFKPTNLGQLLACTGLSVKTSGTLNLIARELVKWESSHYPLNLLFLICLTPEVLDKQWPGLKKGGEDWQIVETLKAVIESASLRDDSLLAAALKANDLPPKEILLAMKRCYLLYSWSCGEGIKEIGRRFGKVHGGDLRSIADVASWVLDAVSQMARDTDDLRWLAPWLRSFAGQVEYGVPPNVLRLARLRVQGYSRRMLVNLATFIEDKDCEDVEEAFELRGCPVPENLREVALDKLQEAWNWKKVAFKANHQKRAGELPEGFEMSNLIAQLYESTDADLELAMFEVLRALGIEEATRSSGAEGAPDITIDLGVALIIVEVKSSGNKVTFKDVRQIQSAVTGGREVTSRVVVAKSGFTDKAIALNSGLPESTRAILLPLETFAELCIASAEENPEAPGKAILQILKEESGLIGVMEVSRLLRR